MKPNLTPRYLSLLLFLASFCAQAEVTEQQIEEDCAKASTFGQAGNEFYQKKLYAKANEQYAQQVGWYEQCGVSADLMAAAYNNMALTYSHQKEYLKAFAWLNLAPDSQPSRYNAKQLKSAIKQANHSISQTPEGEYWDYAGRAVWNVITIKKVQAHYNINFSGYYAGLMAMYYGPNMGEFTATVPIKNGHAHYVMKDNDIGLDCVFDFDIYKTSLKVTLVSGDNCGFGFNVSAQGNYQKVSQ
jgi:tetratricopeptide (TPR) repeat protein